MPGGSRIVNTERIASERWHTAGDAAVNGLLAGAGGGIAMAAALVIAGMLTGVGPASTLAHFDPAGADAASPLTGALIHLAVSAVYGLLFGVLCRWVGRGRWAGRATAMILGLAYGLLLWLMAQGLIATSAGAALREMPALHFAVAHLVYGIVTGWLIARQ